MNIYSLTKGRLGRPGFGDNGIIPGLLYAPRLFDGK